MTEPQSLPTVRPGYMIPLQKAAQATVGLQQAAREATPMVVELWRVVLHRKNWILAAAGVVTLLVILFSLTLTPRYSATALVLFESGGKSRVVSIEDVYGGLGSNRETSTNQLEFLKSRDVSMRVIRKLELADHPEFDPRRRGLLGSVGDLLRRIGLLPDRQPMATEVIEGRVLGRFQQQLQIEPIRLSQLVRITFVSSDRALAAAVANEIATAYIQADLDARFTVTERANEWLNSRLEVLKGKLDRAEADLQAYREQQGLVNTRSVTGGGSGRQLDELNQRLVEARVRRTVAEQAFNQVRPGEANISQVPAIINHPSVQRARGVEIEATRRFNELSARFGSAHPAYRTAEDDARIARETTQREVAAVASSIRKEFEAARAAELSLEQTLARTQTSVQGINRKEIQQSALEREVDVNKQLYNLFLSRQRETSAAANVDVSPARVIDPAVPALEPFAPNRPLIAIGALVASLLLGAVAAIVWHRLDNTLKRADDLEDLVGAPLVAAVPKVEGPDAERVHRLMIESPESHYAESIRSMASAVQLLSLDTPRRVLLVTSAVPGEGKSTVASNLALLQARLSPTLLIEADLRRPTTAVRLGLAPGLPGLTDFVSGARPLAECVHPLPDSKLWVMPCGQHGLNAAELYSTKVFADALQSLSLQFEQVIIDSAPVRPVSDALLLSTHVTGVIFVAAANATPVPLVRWGIKRLADAGARVFGVVLNRYDVALAEKYYGDYASYGDYSAPPKTSTGFSGFSGLS